MTKKSLYPMLTVSAALLLGSAPYTVALAQTPHDDTATAPAQQVDDTWITTKVKSQLAGTDGVKSTDISVTTIDGVVTLTGVLPSKIAVKKAVAVTRAVKGVKHVDAAGLKANA